MTWAALVTPLAVAAALLVGAAPARRPADRLPAPLPAPPTGPPAEQSPPRRRPGRLSVVALPISLVLRRRRRRRAVSQRATAVVDVTYGLAAELRAGRPPAAALAAVAAAGGPLHDPLRAAAAVAASGAPAADELRRIADLPGAGDLGAVAAVWAVTEQHGGPVADVLDRLGDALDADLAARRALDAALAGPRATMVLLLVLPGLGIALGESVGAGTVRFLLHRPVGWALLGAALVLDLAGTAWTRRLLVAAARP